MSDEQWETEIERLTRERDEARAACADLREALAEYATCQSDECTCGDGWSHDTARGALAQTNLGQPLLDRLAAQAKEIAELKAKNTRLRTACSAERGDGMDDDLLLIVAENLRSRADLREAMEPDDGRIKIWRSWADRLIARAGLQDRGAGRERADLRAFCVATIAEIDKTGKD